MHWNRFASVVVLGSLCIPVVARADPFDAKRVPADAKWVVHVDMDAARGTKTWNAVHHKLAANPQFEQPINKIEKLTGMDFPQDLHDVTLFGNGSTEKTGVIVLHAKLDRDKTMASLRDNPGYASQDFGQYQIVSWDNEKNKCFAAFHDSGLVVIGDSQKGVELTLDTLDSKAESLQTGSSLQLGATPQLLLYAAAKDFPDLEKSIQPQSPLLKQIDHAWLGLGEKDGNVVLKVSVTALNADVAKQLAASLEGIKAMAGLAAGGENADPNVKKTVAALASLTTNLKDDTLQIDWSVPLDVISGMVTTTLQTTQPAANSK